jgi:PIN domain nuclease of toxin-antitoxin system
MVTTLLIDTHALLWWLAGDRRLPKSVRDRIADPDNRVLASAVSAWEIAIKTALGKLRAPGELIEVVGESGLSWIPIEPREAYAAGALPPHHRDPFDRLLVAQCLGRSAHLISRDATFDQYGVVRLWR